MGIIGGGGNGGDSDNDGWLTGMFGNGACAVIGGGGGDIPFGPFNAFGPFNWAGFGDVSDAFD